MHARYPAGDLKLAQQPPARNDWSEDADDKDALPAFDRRAMEGMLAQRAREIGEPANAGNRKLERRSS